MARDRSGIRRTMLTLTVLTVLCHWAAPVLGYAGGAPSSACSTMHPSHGAEPQTSKSPYVIRIDEVGYNPGETLVTVTLSGPMFKGFILYSQRADWRQTQRQPVGTFLLNNMVKTICRSSYGHAVTHRHSTDKSSVTVIWEAPKSSQGHIEFIATVVQTKQVYWEAIYSSGISDLTLIDSVHGIPPTTTPSPTLGPQSDMGDIDTSSCGSVKGCLSVPKGCSGSACDLFAAWTPPQSSDETYVTVELMGRTTGWVAFALSEDMTMGLDTVVECVNHEGLVYVSHSYNNVLKGSTIAIRPRYEALSGVNGSYVDGVIRCQFRRAVTSYHKHVVDLNNSYYLFLGRGEASRGVKFQHREIPAVSSVKVNLVMESDNVGGGGLSSSLIKAHAILMVTAWGPLISFAVVLARYFKDAWPGVKLCDRKLVWFSVHRITQLAATLLTGIGFILIFVEVGGFTKGITSVAKAHPVMGIFVTILAAINVIMAMFRPQTNRQNRTLFNWGHLGVGSLAQLLAVITMFLGFQLPSAKLFAPSWLKYMIVLLVIIYLATYATFSLRSYFVQRRQTKINGEIEIGRVRSSSAAPNSYKRRGLRFKYVTLGVFAGLTGLVYAIIFFAIALG